MKHEVVAFTVSAKISIQANALISSFTISDFDALLIYTPKRVYLARPADENSDRREHGQACSRCSSRFSAGKSSLFVFVLHLQAIQKRVGVGVFLRGKHNGEFDKLRTFYPVAVIQNNLGTDVGLRGTHAFEQCEIDSESL
ncbi:hypothetical protein Y032_0016g3006 [Ancylostoma ceylanicum]|uniref:Uncharacterized protein n=1 Tax=Ancylostoma ceylanicum TaxID=53326 RepID=A0A016V5D8_9BILA|nr:hypothetical protein Y032_0016g3006 [Ancylostoma ceylanicum]